MLDEKSAAKVYEMLECVRTSQTLSSAIAGALLYLGFTLLSGAENTLQNPFIDKGACPFEGCVYREWTATKRITLYDEPQGKHIIGHLRPGERVIGITGEVRCIPLRALAEWDHPDPEDPSRILIKKATAYYVLHYEGEGAWLVWYRGKLITVNLSESGSFPKAVWWVKVKTSAGVVGWAISDRNFDGQDSLA
jgi:hypothetical protein